MWQFFFVLIEFGLSHEIIKPVDGVGEKESSSEYFSRGTDKTGTVSYLPNIYGNDQGILRTSYFYFQILQNLFY